MYQVRRSLKSMASTTPLLTAGITGAAIVEEHGFNDADTDSAPAQRLKRMTRVAHSPPIGVAALASRVSLPLT